MNEKILGIITIANIHVARLQFAYGKIIQKWMPVSAKKLAALTMEEFGVFEIFITRFAKLQDLMGTKLFPAIFELTKEPDPPTLFIDTLNRLEKMRVLPSVEDWLTLRNIRNRFTYDYPDNGEQSAILINEAIDKFPKLLNIFLYILKFIDPHLEKNE